MTSCDGSMCTSEARSRTAWVKMLSTTWTTGAFSETSAGPVFDDGALARGLHRLEGLHQLAHAVDGLVAAVDGPPDVAHGRQRQTHGVPAGVGQQEAQVVARLGHRHVQERVVVDADRDGQVLAGDVRRHERQRRRLRRVTAQVGHRHAEVVRQGVGQAPLVEGAHVDQDLAESLAGVRLRLERGVDLTLGHDAPRDEHRAQTRLRRARLHRRCLERHDRLVGFGPREGRQFRRLVTLQREGVAGGLRGVVFLASDSHSGRVGPEPAARVAGSGRSPCVSIVGVIAAALERMKEGCRTPIGTAEPLVQLGLS